MTQGTLNPNDSIETAAILNEKPTAVIPYAKMVTKAKCATWQGNKHDVPQAVVNQRAQVGPLADALRTEVNE